MGSLQADWRDPHHVRENMRMIGQAARQGWNIPDSAFNELPEEVLAIWKDTSIDIGKRLVAIEAVLKMHGQNMKARELESKEPDTPGVSVTVNQYASDGGSITNGSKAALDAAAAFVRLVASDEGEPGGAGVVRDEGTFSSPPALGLAEPEAP